MLFDASASMKAAIGNPRMRRRQKDLVEANLRAFLEKIASPDAKRRLLEEIQACTQVHVRRISLSLSPIGLFRVLVRRTATRSVRDVLDRLRSAPGGAVAQAVVDCQEKA
jgi:hypothetical protein